MQSLWKKFTHFSSLYYCLIKWFDNDKFPLFTKNDTTANTSSVALVFFFCVQCLELKQVSITTNQFSKKWLHWSIMHLLSRNCLLESSLLGVNFFSMLNIFCLFTLNAHVLKVVYVQSTRVYKKMLDKKSDKKN